MGLVCPVLVARVVAEREDKKALEPMCRTQLGCASSALTVGDGGLETIS